MCVCLCIYVCNCTCIIWTPKGGSSEPIEPPQLRLRGHKRVYRIYIKRLVLYFLIFYIILNDFYNSLSLNMSLSIPLSVYLIFQPMNFIVSAKRYVCDVRYNNIPAEKPLHNMSSREICHPMPLIAQLPWIYGFQPAKSKFEIRFILWQFPAFKLWMAGAGSKLPGWSPISGWPFKNKLIFAFLTSKHYR